MRLMFQPHAMGMGADPDKILPALKPMVRQMKMMQKQKMMSILHKPQIEFSGSF